MATKQTLSTRVAQLEDELAKLKRARFVRIRSAGPTTFSTSEDVPIGDVVQIIAQKLGIVWRDASPGYLKFKE